jgi:peptidoglycan/LPS O-acetylase OafA/YrhL
MSTPPGRLPSLTGMRFAAAMLVFGVHAYSFIPVSGAAHRLGHFLFDPGDLGVSFFFVLSGFVLTWAVRGTAGPPLRRFWAGRLLRIYPAYALALAFAVLGKWLGDQIDPAANRMNQVNGHSLATSLLLVQAWFPDDITYLGINPVAWSLSCEMAFYAAFPLLYLLVRRLRVPNLYAVGAGLVATSMLMPPIADAVVGDAGRRWFVYVFPLARMVEFTLGIVLALLVRRGAWRGPGLGLACGLFAANYLAVDLLPDRIRDTAAVLATTALLIPAAAAADLRGSPSRWRGRFLVALGDASYAFFLVHVTVLTLGMQLMGRSRPYPPPVALLLALGFLVLSYALAFALHRWVELPAMSLLRRRESSGGQAVLVGVPDGLGAVAHAGLGEQPVDVRLDRHLADEQPPGDLPVRQPGPDQAEHLDLTGGQRPG